MTGRALIVAGAAGIVGLLAIFGRRPAAASESRVSRAEGQEGGSELLARSSQALSAIGTALTAYRLGAKAVETLPSPPVGTLRDLATRLFGPTDAQAAAAAEQAVGATSAAEAAAFGTELATEVPEILTGATEFGTGGGIEAAAGLESGAGAGTAIASGALSLGVGLALGAAGAPPPVSAAGGALAGTAAYTSAAAIPLYSLYLGAFAGVIGGAISMALDMAESEGAEYLPHRQKAVQGMNGFVVETLERIALGPGTPAAIRQTLSEVQPTVRQFRFDLSIPIDLRQAAFSGGYEAGEQMWPQVNADLQALITALLILVPAAATDADAARDLELLREGWTAGRKNRLRRWAETYWFRGGGSMIDWNGIRFTLGGTWLGENALWYGPGIYSFFPSGYTPQEIQAIITEFQIQAAALEWEAAHPPRFDMDTGAWIPWDVWSAYATTPDNTGGGGP